MMFVKSIELNSKSIQFGGGCIVAGRILIPVAVDDWGELNRAIILSLLKTLFELVEELFSFEDENALSKSAFRFVNVPLFWLTVVDGLANNSCKGLMSDEETFVEVGKTFGTATTDGSSKQPIEIHRHVIFNRKVRYVT